MTTVSAFADEAADGAIDKPTSKSTDEPTGESEDEPTSEVAGEPGGHPGASASTLASYLASGTLRVNADVALVDDPEPVLGSFTVDGMTYAVTGEGEVTLVAVAPGTLAGGLAGDSVGAEGAGRGIGSGWTSSSPRSAAEQVPSGAQPLPAPSAEADGSDEGDAVVGSDPDEGAVEPSTLALPNSVSYDGIDYSLTAIGPRALAGCAADVVSIPASVASVDPTAMQGCPASSVEVAEGNPHLASYDGMLFDADLTRLLLIPEGKQGAARVPETAEGVLASALSHSGDADDPSVGTGGAAFTSRSGCLYDESGQALLWGPATSDSLEDANDVPLAELARSEAYAAASYLNILICTSEQPYFVTTLGEFKKFGSTSGVWYRTISKYTGYRFQDGCLWFKDSQGNRKLYRSSTKQTWTYAKAGTSKTNTTALSSSSTYITPTTTETYIILYNSSYTVTLDKQSGSGGTSSVAVTPYASMPSISVPSRSNYSFNGYYSGTNGSGTKYYTSTGSSYNVWDKTTSSTLYAYWTYNGPTYYSVTLDKRGGTGGSSSATVQSGSRMPSVSVPTLAGWDFAGYTDDFSTNPYLYNKKDGSPTTRTISSSKTLKANWVKELAFDANGGVQGSLTTLTVCKDRPLGQVCKSNAASSSDYPITSLFQTPIEVDASWAPTRIGYRFSGFYDTSATQGGTCYVDAEGATKTAEPYPSSLEPRLYARWSAISYGITLNGNGDGVGMEVDHVDATYDSDVDLPEPKRYGYAFAGWNTEPDGAGSRFAAGANAAPNLADAEGETVTLYAQWALVTDVEVPIALDSVGFELGVPDGTVRVAGTAGDPQAKAPGHLRSSMPVPVAVESVSCEAASDGMAPAGTPEAFWAAHAAYADLEVAPASADGDGSDGSAEGASEGAGSGSTEGSGSADAATTAADGSRALAATGALSLSAGDAVASPDLPAWLSIPAATGSPDGTLAQMGELKLLYGLSLDRLFADPAQGGAGVDILDLLPQAQGSGFAVPTGLLRLTFTVDATRYA